MIDRFAGLLALAVSFAVLPAPTDTDTFFTRYSAFRIVDRDDGLHELVSDGREENWHPGRSVAGTRN